MGKPSRGSDGLSDAATTGAAVEDAAAEPRAARHAAGAPKKMSQAPAGAGDERAFERAPRPPFFEIYKRGQGKGVRVGTALGAGLLIAGGAVAVYDRLEALLPDVTWAVWVRTLIPVLWFAGLGVLAYWLIGVKRQTCDFMIATEGEMKKVNWTTKRELIGSTKVVIFTTVLMGLLLFVVDVLFMLFFRSIHVLGHGVSLTGGGGS